MPAIVYDLFVLVGLLYLATLGSTVGTHVAVLASLELFVSLTLAVLLHEPITSFLIPFVDDNLGFMLPEWLPVHAWIQFIAFAALLWGMAFVLWTCVHPRITPVSNESMSQIDRAGGALVGWFGGMVLIGAAMISLSMLPIGLLQFPSRHMMLDVGSTALRAAGTFVGEKHEGRSVVLHGEPTSRESVSSAKLASEAWFDADGNGQTDEGDPYCDSDGNGKFTKDLYYLDIDADGARRVGLLEKYLVNRWDLAIRVGSSERSDKAKVVTKPPARPVPATQPPSQPQPSTNEPTPPLVVKPPASTATSTGTKATPPDQPPSIDEF